MRKLPLFTRCRHSLCHIIMTLRTRTCPFTSAAAAIMCALLSQGLAVTPHHLFACWGGICHTSGGTCLACGMCHVWGYSGRAHCSFSGFVREYHAYMCVWSVHFACALSRALADGAHHLRAHGVEPHATQEQPRTPLCRSLFVPGEP